MGFCRWVVDRQLKKIMQKKTTPAYDADTDSNEALSDAIALKDKTVAGTIIQDGATGDPATVTIASSTSADTFGDWVTVDAAAAADVWISHVTVYNSGDIANGQDWAIEIGTGVSPTAKIRFSGVGTGAIAQWEFSIPIPIKVASGTAIKARVSDQEAAANNYIIGVSYYTGL